MQNIFLFQNNSNLQRSKAAGKKFKQKNRTDISIKPKRRKFSLLKEYINELHKCYLDYLEQWPFLKRMASKMDIGPFNIGEYLRKNINQYTSQTFAFMTYLNDVEDGGETKFSIKPEIGKAIIWPAEWTHAHSGEILNSGTKYIITGWLHFS